MTEPSIVLQLNITITPGSDPRLLYALDELISASGGTATLRQQVKQPHLPEYFTLEDYRSVLEELYFPTKTRGQVRGYAEASFWALLHRVDARALKVYHIACRQLRSDCTCGEFLLPHVYAVDLASFLGLEIDVCRRVNMKSRAHLKAAQAFMRRSS